MFFEHVFFRDLRARSVPYPVLHPTDVQENMTADSELPPTSVYECLPHMPENKENNNTFLEEE